jgi:hypothetical protein
MNKLFKFILLTFFVILSFLAANAIKENEDYQKVTENYAVSKSTQIYLPSPLNQTSNYQAVLETIKEVSAETGTPFTFRLTDIGYPAMVRGQSTGEVAPRRLPFLARM